MGVRHSVDLNLQVGLGTNLSPALFTGSVVQVLDTLARSEAGTYTLEALEQNVQVDFGDVTQARVIWIDSDGALEVTLGGTVGTVATLLGAGTFPTSFAGGEAFSFEIDGTTVAGTFLIADQSVVQCAQRLNAAAMLAGLTYVPFVVDGGQIRVNGADASLSGKVEVLTINATLGFPALTSDLGTDPLSGSAPIQLRKPIAADASSASGVSVYALLTAVTGSITLTSLESAQQSTVRVAVLGDVL